ncbi:RTA1-domain-containing protein [Diplocarpon rosae]|nr:RTA1-domain-containing protein [Diplocarpon rosae]
MTRAPIDSRRSTDGNIYAYDANEDAAIVAAVFFGLVTGLQLGMMVRKKTYFYLPLVCGGFMMTGGYVVRYLSAQSPDRASLYAAQNAAIVAAVFFGLVTGLQLGMMVRKKTYFYLPLVCGGFMMTGGYVVRYLSAQSPDRASLYAAQSLLLLLPPSLFAATLYMTYGRIVMLVKKTDASVIRPERVTGIFVVGDLLAFSVQLAGGGVLVSDGDSSIGKIVVLAGLGIQLAFSAFFLTIAIIFDHRMTQAPRRGIIPIYGKYSWRKLLVLLILSSVVITVRCVYRIVEYSTGTEGFAMSHEICGYLADTILMFGVFSAFLFVHAGDVLPKKSDQEKMEDKSYIGLEDRL